MIFEDEEQSLAVIEDYKPGQVNIYVDASVRKGRAGIGVYATPSQAHISTIVASSDQADAHLTELVAINEAANLPWGPSSVALDGDGFPLPAYSIRFFLDSQSALLSMQSWRASACQEVVAEIIKKLWMSNVVLYWIPGHTGIEGNEEADKLSKAATRKESEEPPQRDGKPWCQASLALKKAGIERGSLPSRRTVQRRQFWRSCGRARYS
jgi:ribonuclease HI